MRKTLVKKSKKEQEAIKQLMLSKPKNADYLEYYFNKVLGGGKNEKSLYCNK